jgi:arabinan endo-1,5-alpha-L-arabinosidase
MKMIQRAVVVAGLLMSAVGAMAAEPATAKADDAQDFLRRMGNRNIGVHDPSTIVQCDGEFYEYYTGANVPSIHSKDMVTWERGPTVIPHPPAWVKQDVPGNGGGGFWAPDVIKVGDKYMLFFSASTFGKNISTIGVVTSPTLNPKDPAYKWSEGERVVRSVEKDDFNCIDPAAFLDKKDGRMWLSFGSFWSGIKLIELDPKTGLRIAPNSPMYSLSHWDAVEASYVYQHGDYYYLFVSMGMCCRGVNSTYHTRVGRATQVTGPYVDKEGKEMMQGGGTTVADTEGVFIGPGHAGIIEVDGKYWFSDHFYDGTARGASKLSIRPLTWSDDGWPVVGKLD